MMKWNCYVLTSNYIRGGQGCWVVKENEGEESLYGEPLFSCDTVEEMCEWLLDNMPAYVVSEFMKWAV